MLSNGRVEKLKEVLDAHELLCVESHSSSEIWDAHMSHQPTKAKYDGAWLVMNCHDLLD